MEAFLISVGILFIFVVIYLIWLVVDIWILRLQTPEKVYRKIYSRIMRIGKYFMIEEPEYLTPQELSDQYYNNIHDLISQNLISDSYENLLYELNILLTSCENFAYNPNPHKYMEKFKSIDAWREIRRRLTLILLTIKIRLFGDNIKNFLVREKPKQSVS